jgi:TolB-like protein
MRKAVILTLFIWLGGAFVFAQEDTVTLSEGIHRSLAYLIARLPQGSKVVILNFTAPTPDLSDYIIEGLTDRIVNNESLTVVDRKNLGMVRQELDFNLSGQVSDETAQAIGKMLGAQIIISGSIAPLRDIYRMRLQAIGVETAQILGAQTELVALDATLADLLGINGYFSTGRKVGAGALNLTLGIGSFTMGDVGGGLTLLAGYAVAVGLIAYELVGLTYEDDLAGVMGPIGVGVAGITALYGFIRPFIYHKSTRTTLVDILDRVRIAAMPDNSGTQAVSLSYTFHY